MQLGKLAVSQVDQTLDWKTGAKRSQSHQWDGGGKENHLPPRACRSRVSDHHDERRTARSQARRSRNFFDRNYMCLRATPLFGDSTPHLASPPTVFNSRARKASSPFIGILHTGEVQGSIPCAPTINTIESITYLTISRRLYPKNLRVQPGHRRPLMRNLIARRLPSSRANECHQCRRA